MSTSTVGRPRLDASGPLQHVNIRVPRSAAEWAETEARTTGRSVGEVLRSLLLEGLAARREERA